MLDDREERHVGRDIPAVDSLSGKWGRARYKALLDVSCSQRRAQWPQWGTMQRPVMARSRPVESNDDLT